MKRLHLWHVLFLGLIYTLGCILAMGQNLGNINRILFFLVCSLSVLFLIVGMFFSRFGFLLGMLFQPAFTFMYLSNNIWKSLKFVGVLVMTLVLMMEWLGMFANDTSLVSKTSSDKKP